MREIKGNNRKRGMRHLPRILQAKRHNQKVAMLVTN